MIAGQADETVEVHLLGHGLQPADLVVIGSHCVGLDYLLGRMQEQGFRSKFLAVGSTGNTCRSPSKNLILNSFFRI